MVVEERRRRRKWPMMFVREMLSEQSTSLDVLHSFSPFFSFPFLSSSLSFYFPFCSSSPAARNHAVLFLFIASPSSLCLFPSFLLIFLFFSLSYLMYLLFIFSHPFCSFLLSILYPLLVTPTFHHPSLFIFYLLPNLFLPI